MRANTWSTTSAGVSFPSRYSFASVAASKLCIAARENDGARSRRQRQTNAVGRSYELLKSPKHSRDMGRPIRAGMATTTRFVPGDPYPWPWNGDLRPENTALIVIDMQTDFCGKGGYIDLLGYDISLTRACIDPIRRVLEKFRASATRSCTPARATAPISPTCRPTSAGDRDGRPEMKASGSATVAPAGEFWSAASRDGTSSPSSRPARARRSSTSPAKDRSARPISI